MIFNEQIIIYLDIFVFLILIAFFIILFKSRSFLIDNKKDGKFYKG